MGEGLQEYLSLGFAGLSEPGLRDFKGCKDRLNSLQNRDIYIHPYIL